VRSTRIFSATIQLLHCRSEFTLQLFNDKFQLCYLLA
jgi:hypothetical protein